MKQAILLKENIMKIKSNYKKVLLLFACATICLFANPQKIAAQDEMEKQIDAATHVLLKNRSKGYAEFNKIGAKVIPYLVKIIFDDEVKQTPFQKAVRVSFHFVSVIAQFENDEAETALITLLTHPEPHIRGMVALHLAGRKSEKSIPNLVSLLNDENIYVIESSSAEPDKYILVRDVVVQALEEITETKLLPDQDYKAKAKAWAEWWQAKETTKCR